MSSRLYTKKKNFNGGRINLQNQLPSSIDPVTNPTTIPKKANHNEAEDNDAEEEKKLEEERLADEAREAEREAEIDRLKKEIEDLKIMLLNDTTMRDIEGKKYKSLEDFTPDDLTKLEEYTAKYKEYLGKIQELDELMADDENKESYFKQYIINPITSSIGNIFKGFKKGAATALVSTGKFWIDTFALSMEKVEPSLIKIQEIKAQIAASGKIATQKAEAGLATATTDAATATEGLTTATTGLETATTGLETAAAGLETAITDKDKKIGGSNIREVQKGGAAAAKRAENSIKQFLNSSVTSSQILNMLKRKTKSKRRKARYSRKRARK